MSFDAVNTNYMTHQSSTARKTITDQSPTGVEWAEREGSERNSADPEKYESLLTNEFMRCRASWVQASRPRKEFSTTGLERGGSFRSRHGFVCVGGRPGEMNGSDKTKGRQIAEGEVPKRPTGADCKSAGICLRRFKSSSLHHFLLRESGPVYPVAMAAEGPQGSLPLLPRSTGRWWPPRLHFLLWGCYASPSSH